MSNQNPIYLNQTEKETDFIIPQAYLTTDLSLTVSIDILTPEWQYVPLHQLFLNAQDLFPIPEGDPVNILLGNGSNLIGKKLLLMSSISRILPSGGATTATKVKFSLHIFSGAQTIENFEVVSGIENPSQFNALINFKTAS